MTRLWQWLLVALAVLVPGWAFFRERRLRKQAETAFAEAVEQGRRMAELERDRRAIIADRHARETKVRTETEKAAVAHETRAQDVGEIADDLEALAMELDGTGK
jgi:uncharacterized protein HemX